MKKYLVETISQHLVRYVVEAQEEDHALDEVTTKVAVYDEECTEFSQKHVGDSILSSLEITDEEFVDLFDKDNDYLAHWDDERKLERFVNKIKYDE